MSLSALGARFPTLGGLGRLEPEDVPRLQRLKVRVGSREAARSLRDLSGRKCGCGRCAAEVRPRALPQASRVAGAPTPAASVGAAAAPVLASLSETKKTRDPKEPPMKSEQTFQHVKKAPRLLWKKSVPGPSLLIT